MVNNCNNQYDIEKKCIYLYMVMLKLLINMISFIKMYGFYYYGNPLNLYI